MSAGRLNAIRAVLVGDGLLFLAEVLALVTPCSVLETAFAGQRW